jgi:hypothetical protein
VNWARRGTAGRGGARHGKAWLGEARQTHCATWWAQQFGLAGRGEAGRGKAWHGRARQHTVPLGTEDFSKQQTKRASEL